MLGLAGLSEPADLVEQRGRRALVFEGDGMHGAAAGQGFGRPDDALGGPVAALHQHVGLAFEDAGDRGVLVEPGDEIDAAERGHHRQAVGEGVDGAVIALALAAHGGVAVEGDDHRGAERAGLAEVSDVAPVQDVETAVGEHQRAGQGGHALAQLVGRRQLAMHHIDAARRGGQGAQPVQQLGCVGVGRGDQDLRCRLSGQDAFQRGEAAAAGHRQVHQQYIDFLVAHQVDGLAAVGGFALDPKVHMLRQELLEPGTNNRMVIHNANLDH